MSEIKKEGLCPHCVAEGSCQGKKVTEEKLTESQKRMDKVLEKIDKAIHILEEFKEKGE